METLFSQLYKGTAQPVLEAVHGEGTEDQAATDSAVRFVNADGSVDKNIVARVRRAKLEPLSKGGVIERIGITVIIATDQIPEPVRGVDKVYIKDRPTDTDLTEHYIHDILDVTDMEYVLELD